MMVGKCKIVFSCPSNNIAIGAIVKTNIRRASITMHRVLAAVDVKLLVVITVVEDIIYFNFSFYVVLGVVVCQKVQVFRRYYEVTFY